MEPGRDAPHRFVSVNALYVAPDGTLRVVDTGTPSFGGAPVSVGYKLARIDPATGHVLRIYPLAPEIAQADSYSDGIHFIGTHTYLTNAGKAALIVLNNKTGHARRVLDSDVSTRARIGRPIVMDRNVVESPPHQPFLLMSIDPPRRLGRVDKRSIRSA